MTTHLEHQMTDDTVPPRPDLPPMPQRVQPTNAVVHQPQEPSHPYFLAPESEDGQALTTRVLSDLAAIGRAEASKAVKEVLAKILAMADKYEEDAKIAHDRAEDTWHKEDWTVHAAHVQKLMMARAGAAAIRRAVEEQQ
jgi:hypothetical protein